MDEKWLDLPVYDLAMEEKQALLRESLCELQSHHTRACEPYLNLLTAYNVDVDHCPDKLENFFPLAVRLFKYYDLKSVSDDDVFKTLHSSGTSGNPSSIALDRATAADQSRVLVKIMQQWLGKQRLPMLIADHPGIVRAHGSMSARGAGIQGMSFVGRDHTYALNDDMSYNHSTVEAFAEKYADTPILVFGFTFMVWQYFIQPLIKSGIRFSNAILLHGGGWKKLESLSVTVSQFKQKMQLASIDRVHSYYGMVEQVGSIFVECEKGYLHAPVYSDIISRDIKTGESCDFGETGVIELLSVIPESYPGHVLLTEDMGVVYGEDNCPCGRKGRYFHVTGRIPKVESRGCSDTFVQKAT